MKEQPGEEIQENNFYRQLQQSEQQEPLLSLYIQDTVQKENRETTRDQQMVVRCLGQNIVRSISLLVDGNLGNPVGCDGFHLPECRREVVEVLEKVEQCGRWPQQACTTMFFLTPKNVTSERPTAVMLTMTRWLKALRAPEVPKCNKISH